MSSYRHCADTTLHSLAYPAFYNEVVQGAEISEFQVVARGISSWSMYPAEHAQNSLTKQRRETRARNWSWNWWGENLSQSLIHTWLWSLRWSWNWKWSLDNIVAISFLRHQWSRSKLVVQSRVSIVILIKNMFFQNNAVDDITSRRVLS